MANHEIHVSDYGERDIAALAQVHRNAYRGYMNAGIGAAYTRQFLRWFLSHPAAIALKAECDGTPCGYVVGMPQNDHAQLNHDLLFVSALGVVTHPWVLLQKRYRSSAIAKIKRIAKFRRNRGSATASEPPPAWVPKGRVAGLVSIAVGPQFGGKGIGVAAVNEFTLRARKLGYDSAQLSVLTDNSRARNVYVKAGWDEVYCDGRVVYYTKKLAAGA